MKAFIFAAVIAAATVPFLVSADICGKPECANGPVEFGQQAERKDTPVHSNAKLGVYGQAILGTEWFKNQMREIARQLTELGKLHLFPSFQVWNY